MVRHDHEIEEHYFARVENSHKFHCKERNDAEACHKLADFIEKIKKKPHLAYDFYKENCFTRDYGDSCFKYGVMTFNQSLQKQCEKQGNLEEKVQEALRAHVKGCEVKRYNGASCHVVGFQHLTKHFTPEMKKVIGRQNPKKAIDLFKKGCEGEDGISCLSLSQAYRDGLKEARLKPDPESMFKYALKACEFKNLPGCKIVADAYKNGIGTQQDDELYKKYQAICDLSSKKKARENLRQ